MARGLFRQQRATQQPARHRPLDVAAGPKAFDAKAATASNAKVTQLNRANGLGAKAGTASSQKASLSRGRPVAAKAGTSTSAKATLRSTRPIAAKSGTASGSKAVRIVEAKRFAAKSGTASGLKTPLARAQRYAAKVPTSAGAKALRVTEAKRFAAKSGTSHSAKADLTRTIGGGGVARTMSGKISIASSARAGDVGIKLVQKAESTLNATTTTPTATFAATPTPGNFLVSVFGSVGSAAQTVTAPAGWTFVTGFPLDINADATSPWDGRVVAVAYKVAGASESTAVQWTHSANVSCDVVAMEFSGLSASPFDQLATNQSAANVGTLSFGPTGTLAQANELALLINSGGSPRTDTITGGFARQTALNSRSFAATQVVGATTGLSGTLTWSTGNTTMVGGILTLKGVTAAITNIGLRVARAAAGKAATASTMILRDGGVSSPADVANLGLWLNTTDATKWAVDGSNNLTSVTDNAGQTITVIGTVKSGTRSINGRNGFDFLGGSVGYLGCGSGSVSPVERTAFVAVIFDTTSSGAEALISSSNQGWSWRRNNDQFGITQLMEVLDELVAHHFPSPLGTRLGDGIVFVLSVKWTRTGYTLHTNGVVDGVNTDSYTPSATGTVRIGSTSTSGIDGILCEPAYYDRALTSTEWTNVERYYLSRYLGTYPIGMGFRVARAAVARAATATRGKAPKITSSPSRLTAKAATATSAKADLTRTTPGGIARAMAAKVPIACSMRLAPAWTPASIGSSLKGWYGEDSLISSAGAYTAWNDKSGSGNNATAVGSPPTGSTVNGMAVALLNGTSQYFTLSGAALDWFKNVGGAMVFAAVQNQAGAGSGQGRIFYHTTGSSSTSGRAGADTNRVGPNYGAGGRRLDADAAYQSADRSDGLFQNITKIFCFEFDWANAAVRVYDDTGSVVSNTSFQAAGNTSNTSAQAGYLGYAPTPNPWKGYLCELLFVIASPDATLRTNALGYLKRWTTGAVGGVGFRVARAAAAKVPTSSSQKAPRINRLRPVVAKVPTSTSAKATEQVARAAAAKVSTSSSAKALRIVETKRFSAKAGTSSGLKAPLARAQRYAAKLAASTSAKAPRIVEVKRFAAKSATSSSQKAPWVSEVKRYQAKVGTASSLKARLDTKRAELAAHVSTSISAKATSRTARPLASRSPISAGGRAAKLTQSKRLVAKAATSTKAKADLTLGGQKSFSAKAAAATSAKALMRETERLLAKSAASTSAKALRINRSRPVSAKAATTSGLTAPRINRLLRHIAKVGSSSSAKVSLLRRGRPISAKSGTATGAKARLDTQRAELAAHVSTAISAKAVDKVARPLVSKSPAVSGGRATKLTQQKRLAAKVGTSTKAKADLSLGGQKSFSVKAATASSAKASSVRRARPVVAKAPTSASFKALLREAKRLLARIGTATSAKADLSKGGQKTFSAKVAISTSAKAPLVRRTRPISAKVATCSSSKALRIARTRPMTAKSASAISSRSLGVRRGAGFVARAPTSTHARALNRRTTGFHTKLPIASGLFGDIGGFGVNVAFLVGNAEFKWHCTLHELADRNVALVEQKWHADLVEPEAYGTNWEQKWHEADLSTV